MIDALIGLSRVITGRDMYVSIVFMSLPATIITPLIYRHRFCRDLSDPAHT